MMSKNQEEPHIEILIIVINWLKEKALVAFRLFLKMILTYITVYNRQKAIFH